MTHSATCEIDGHQHEVVEAPTRGASDPAPPAGRRRAGRVGSFLTLPEMRWAALSLLAFVLAVAVSALAGPAAISVALFAVCYATGGWAPALDGIRALRDKVLDVDLLMIVAALVAAGIGQVFDGALLIVIFSTSGALEAVATKRTQDAVRSLLTLAPEQATMLHDGQERVVDTATLTIGDLILVRPGERIGADGHVLNGASDVDQASITGEPLPVAKTVGAEVFAGTLNGTGALQVRVDREPADSVVARIATLVEEASATKARTQLFIDKIEQRYSVAVVAATIALVVLPLALGAEFQPTLLRAMTFMIVASPCAVVLATMPPLLCAIANAGRHGVLVKSAVVMEQLGRTGLVAFDKTGTLTEGTPKVAEIATVADAPVSTAELLALAAAAERPSEHPLAGAVVAAATNSGLAIGEASEFSSRPGRGVTATVDGHRIAVGSPLLLDGNPHTNAEIAGLVTAMQNRGRTAVIVTIDDVPVGVLGLADQPRPAAARVVADLTQLTGRTPVLLTGDNLGAASQLGAEVGITDVRAQLLPHDKVNEVRELQTNGTHVTLIGDGVNDAPALAAANTAIAMGRHGADLALETADVVIVRDDLATIPALIGISRQARRVVTQNLIIAATVITTLVIIDLTGHLPLPLGVAGHEGSTVIVGLNGLRLLSRRAWNTPPPR